MNDTADTAALALRQMSKRELRAERDRVTTLLRNAPPDRSRLLAALDCVDAVVVFDEPTPESVLTWLRPDVWVKGGDYADGGPEMPEAELVRRWGGQTVIVPYLDGRSTTKTIAAARATAARR